MPRLARVVIPGLPHHVTQRGTRSQDIFVCEGDRERATSRYVLRNPVRAGLGRVPWTWEWSSAAFHVGKKPPDQLVKQDDEIEKMVGDWVEYLTGENSVSVTGIAAVDIAGRGMPFYVLLTGGSARANTRGT